MNKLSPYISLVVIGAGLIYWEIQTMKEKKKKGEYSPIDSVKVFSGLALGVVLILGGLFNIILL